MANRETYFRVRKQGKTLYFKTSKTVTEYVWINIDTGNVYLRRPKQIEVPQFQAYRTYVMTKPSERALNEADWVV